MLERIILEHFKCFEQLKLPLAPLTILSGLNASGKSTVMQSLALFHQTLTENPASPGLILNGKNVTLGTADELVDKVYGRGTFGIGFEHDQILAQWEFGVEPDDEFIAPLQQLSWKDANGVIGTETRSSNHSILQLVPLYEGMAHNPLIELLHPLIETLRKLTYVSADRIGPRETYPTSSRMQQTGVGAKGEFAPWFIHQNEDLDIPDGMCHENSLSPKLPRQVEAWLSHFFPGAGLDVKPLQGTSLMTLRLSSSDTIRYYRPTNIGYGLSHVLPVITACLGAVGFAQQEQRAAPLVLVENPELHLHPAGQSAMGKFLARTAASGAQVIIETHSDHVLNGVRLAVKGGNESPILNPEQVAIHFFQPRDEQGQRPQVISPLIDASGTLDSWPEGFFDQFDKDTASLIDW